MSVTISLVSAAIMVGVTISSASSMALISGFSKGTTNLDDPIETMFNDHELLVKTLTAHNACVNVVSENEIIVKTSAGNMKYVRENQSQAFGLLLDEISNPDVFFDNLKSFEVDYGRNVQEYTYNHIKENLTDEMSIEDEVVLDDDSLLLTINLQ